MNAPEDRASWLTGEDAELSPGAAMMEALAAWLKVHAWPCAIAFVVGCYFTLFAAYVWSFWL